MEKKRKSKKKELTEATQRERKSKEDEDEWVHEKREMKHNNKSNNDVACFHWSA